MTSECWILWKIHDQRDAGSFLEIHDQRDAGSFWKYMTSEMLDPLEIHEILGDLSQNLNLEGERSLVRRLNLEGYRCENRIFQMSLIYD